VWLGPSPNDTGLFAVLNSSVPGGWFSMFLTGLKASFIDLDAVGGFPALLWVAVAAILISRGASTARKWIKDPIPTFVLLNILIQGVLTSALVETETGAQYAILRYMPHLIVFGLLAGFVLVHAAIRTQASHVPVCAAVVCLNMFTLSFWMQPSGRTVPVSWMQEVFSEILWPQDRGWEEIVQKLRAQSQGPRGAETLLLGLPEWTQEILIFYVGDRYLIRPVLHAPSEGIEQVLKNVLGEGSAKYLRGQPEWLVDSLDVQRAGSNLYGEVASIPSHRARPDDGARPELTRHTFAQSEAVRTIRLFRLQGEPTRR
jgi:hypothetical protein